MVKKVANLELHHGGRVGDHLRDITHFFLVCLSENCLSERNDAAERSCHFVGHVGSQQVEHVVLGLKHFCLAVLSKIVDREDGAILVVEGDSIMGE